MRRATLDDLVELRKLWQQATLPTNDLEKRLTEFQIFETADGTLLGAIGLKLDSQQGKIHSAAFRARDIEDELRGRLWERIQAVARNHGLLRLWTAEPEPFWLTKGFEPASAKALDKLPGSFGDRQQRWLTLQLREESATGLSLEQEFELFKQNQKEASERVLRQARALKVLAGIIAILATIVAAGIMYYLMRRLPRLKLPKSGNP